MKRWIWIGAGILLVLVIALAGQRGNADADVRRVVEQVSTAALNGLNRRDPNALNTYFATVDEGAQPTGLELTQQAYQTLASQLRSNGASVQFHSFDIEDVEVHEDGGLARVTYRLHLSIIRGGAAVFSARVSQNVALVNTSRGWRISGGDTPEFADVTGTWSPA